MVQPRACGGATRRRWKFASSTRRQVRSNRSAPASAASLPGARLEGESAHNRDSATKHGKILIPQMSLTRAGVQIARRFTGEPDVIHCSTPVSSDVGGTQSHHHFG